MTAQTDYAVTITAKEQAELLPVERDDRPLAPMEVAGRTLVTLISAGTELAACYQGSGFPSVPGYAAVFEVEAVGDEVEDLQAGQHVFCTGSHRSCQRQHRENVLPLPEQLTPEVGVFARMTGISMSTLTTTTARPPAKVVVTGLGLVGHLAAKVFVICGYEVIACDPDEVRRDIAARAGIRDVRPTAPIDDPSIAGEVALVVECSGHEQAALDGCNLVHKRGEVVLVGVPWERKTVLTARQILDAVFHKYVVLRSGWEWEVPRHPTEFRTNSISQNFVAALEWLADGRLSVDGLYEKVPPREAQRAYQDLLHMRAERLAVVFDWAQCP